MRDVEDQLRIYGDAVESEQAKGPYVTTVAEVSASVGRRRGVLVGLLVAAVVTVAAVALVAVRDGRPRPDPLGHGRGISASLSLDADHVHVGEDVFVRVRIRNASRRALVVRAGGSEGCPSHGLVGIGKTRREAELGTSRTCPAQGGPTLLVKPGVHDYRVVVPSWVRAKLCSSCRPGYSVPSKLPEMKTEVWELVTRPITRRASVPLTIAGRAEPGACGVDQIEPTDTGPTTTQSQTHRIVLRNVSRRACQIDGAPSFDAQQLVPNVDPVRGRRRRVVLRPGDSGSFHAYVMSGRLCGNTINGRPSWTIELPDRWDAGTTVAANPPDSCGPAVAITNFVKEAGAPGRTRPSTATGVTASLHLDKSTVDRGEDVTGMITFDNHTDHVVAAFGGPSSCLLRWQVVFGKDRPGTWGENLDCDRVGTNPRAVRFEPGRTRMRFVLPTTFTSCGERGEPKCGGAQPQAPLLPQQRTKVWLATPKGLIKEADSQSLTIRGPARRPFCVAKDLTVADGGAVLTGEIRPPGSGPRRLVVMNIARHPCRLDGAPATWVTTSTESIEPPLTAVTPPTRRLAESVILRPNAQASFLADVILNHVFLVPEIGPPTCEALQIHVRLPDHGGTIELAPREVHLNEATPGRPTSGLQFSTWPPTLACATSITALSNFVAGAHVDATVLDPTVPTEKRA